MSFAKVAIVGNLGSDPESRYLQSGTLVVSFSIAARGRRRGQDGEAPTTWFRVSAFGEQAERLANMVQRGYINKGKLLYVEGQLEARDYTTNDGQHRTSLDVNLSDWQFIGSGRDQQQGGDQGGFGGGQNRGGYNSNQGGYNNANQSDSNQGSQGGYGGSDYGDQYGGESEDMNDVPF